MSHHLRAGLVALLLAAAPCAARGEISARFLPAAQVSSLEFRSAGERNGIFRELARYLERTGSRLLPPGRSASIELLEVRPAGRLEPWRSRLGGARILTDVTPPSIRLRYTASERGRVVASGEERLSDINYLSNLAARYSSDRLAYEKGMLRDWLSGRLARLEPARR